MFLNWSFSNLNKLPKTVKKKKKRQKLSVLLIKTKDKHKKEIWRKKRDNTRPEKLYSSSN